MLVGFRIQMDAEPCRKIIAVFFNLVSARNRESNQVNQNQDSKVLLSLAAKSIALDVVAVQPSLRVAAIKHYHHCLCQWSPGTVSKDR